MLIIFRYGALSVELSVWTRTFASVARILAHLLFAQDNCNTESALKCFLLSAFKRTNANMIMWRWNCSFYDLSFEPMGIPISWNEFFIKIDMQIDCHLLKERIMTNTNLQIIFYQSTFILQLLFVKNVLENFTGKKLGLYKCDLNSNVHMNSWMI